MTTAPTGPRPMTETERHAFTLYCEGVAPAKIAEITKLRPAQIAAAIDLARLHARLKLAPVETPAAAAAPAPRAGRRGPSAPHDLVEKNRVLTALVKTLREQLAKYEAELAELRATHPAADLEPPVDDVASTSPAAAARADLADSDEVRDWAIAEGWHVPAEGRLPGGIVAAYLRTKGVRS